MIKWAATDGAHLFCQLLPPMEESLIDCSALLSFFIRYFSQIESMRVWANFLALSLAKMPPVLPVYDKISHGGIGLAAGMPRLSTQKRKRIAMVGIPGAGSPHICRYWAQRNQIWPLPNTRGACLLDNESGARAYCRAHRG